MKFFLKLLHLVYILLIRTLKNIWPGGGKKKGELGINAFETIGVTLGWVTSKIRSNWREIWMV